MKQKVVIQVSMNDQKSKAKAMKIAVGLLGVDGAALKGEEKNQLEVTGEGFDAVVLTSLLRKSLGHAKLVSVGPLKEEKGSEDKKPEKIIFEHVQWPSASGFPHFQLYEMQQREPFCVIL